MVEVYNSVFAIKDKYPVTESHLLILPKRHTRDYFSMTAKERMDADKLIRVLRNRITRDDPTVTGFNIGMNAGVSAGQTIFHAHIHLIPRRDKDTPNPHGGVRGVIPEKMAYTVSTAPEQKP
jgi:diadenosine tetraphosphate (Ap4A) HIT family hydrolase